MRNLCIAVCSILLIAKEGTSFEVGDAQLWNAGFSVNVQTIDEPDYWGDEKVEGIYESLQHLWNRPLPSRLPRELNDIRSKIHGYINRKPSRTIVGKNNTRHRSGTSGVNNGAAFDYSLDGLPDKLTRLSFCFGLNPRVVVKWIEKESNFVGSAISYTGAYGFTQMTSIAAVEVSEQLGYGHGTGAPGYADSSAVRKTLEGYIDCYMGENNQWVNPWVTSTRTVTAAGKPILHPTYKQGITRCPGGGRCLKSPYSIRYDNWISGRGYGSHDFGLVYGAILLKLLVGKYGYSKGLVRYNNDNNPCGKVKIKNCYSRTILRGARAFRVDYRNEDTMQFEIDGEIYFVKASKVEMVLSEISFMKNLMSDVYSKDELDSLIQKSIERRLRDLAERNFEDI